MENPNGRFLLKWASTRKLGRQRYVFRNGFIGFGITLTVLFTLVEFVTRGSLEMSYLISRVVLLPTLGIIIFSNQWDSQEKKYNRLQV
ncbi:hypothetical protein [Paenibacillus sp.]|uniref:hypothetical protein n=1 Tax=Paenibacillus sp. TaxID=58172 RepID=UPI0035699C30